MNVSRLDKEIGIEVYSTHSPGVGGRLRQYLEDFRVEELLKDGSIAQIEPSAVPTVEGRGRYLVSVLVKRNIDTFLAIQAVVKKLRLSEERVQFAGIKDTRALTAQHISISRILPEQMTQIKLNNLWLYPMAFSHCKIHSGLLAGNRFRITVRAISHSKSEIAQRLKSVNNELFDLGGCPNFFGHQRFGTVRPITHLVGKALVQGQWERAAFVFLAKPSLYEHPESRQARERLWVTGDYEEAHRNFPSRLVYERRMLGHLAKQPRDFIGAFRRLPNRLCQLFVQAYQSYLFNRFLSQRIRRGLPLLNARQAQHGRKVDRRGQLTLPLLGYRQSFSTGEQGEIERQILEDECIKPEDFRLASARRISSQGGLRAMLMPLTNFSIDKTEKDNAGSSKMAVGLCFTLGKGSYATIVLREFMKPRNPVKSGF